MFVSFELELPYLIRKIVLLVKPNVEVIWDDELDHFDIVVYFLYFSYASKFKMNEIVEEKIPFTGEVIKKIVTKTDDGKYLAKQLNGQHEGAQYLSQFDDNFLIVQMMYRDVTAIRAWKRKV